MTAFDKILMNLQKGYERLKQGAAIFSERAKFEMNLFKMRIKINSMRQRITELQAEIGRKVVELHNGDTHPRTFEAFLKDEEVTACLEEITELIKEVGEITDELSREQEQVIAAAKENEESKA